MFKNLMARVDRALDLYERSVEAQEEIALQLSHVNGNLADISDQLKQQKQWVARAFFPLGTQSAYKDKSVLLNILDELRPQKVGPHSPPNIRHYLARIARSLELATNSNEIERALQQTPMICVAWLISWVSLIPTHIVDSDR